MDEPDEHIVERVVAGDTAAFRHLVARHADTVFRVCLRITGDTQAAEDAAQDAFLSAFRALRDFDGQARFGTWMHRIALNAALQLMRREGSWRSRRCVPGDGEGTGGFDALPDASAPGPEREAASRFAGEATARALAVLTDTERLAFVLRHFEGMALREIADRLALTEGAVKQAVLRGVRKLRVALAAHEELRNHG